MQNQHPSLEEHGSLAYVYLISIIAAIGGILFGYDTAVIAGAIGFLKTHFALDAVREGWAVGAVLVGCVFGASFAGMLSDRFGRKMILIFSALLFILSAIGSAVPRTLSEFVAARFIGGLGVGAASMLSPLYIAEISPASIRGRLVSLNQFAIISGILLAYIADWLLVGIGPTNWRWMFASETLPAVIFLFFLIPVPESPRWMIKQGKDHEALATLTRIGGKRHAEQEMREIKETIALETGSLSQLFQPGLRIALLIGVALAILQQVTGINTVLYYAPRIFEHAGYAQLDSLLMAVIVGVVNLLFTIVALWLIDKLGRKALLLIGSAGMGLFFFLSGCAFHFELYEGPWILIFILLYVGSFAMSMGPVVWVVMSEIFPTRIRGRAMSIATVFLWISCFLVSLTFPILVDHISDSFTFWLYASMCVVTFFFVLLIVPETKGKTLEEIEKGWLT
ncbi:MAG: MFS transporter [Candidatus Omnitrophota bacterium]|jgi:sugar porter (SP) family MFS transporter|nr:MAG: MFS transporter [Candidatus Omnitrophota bacterium]